MVACVVKVAISLKTEKQCAAYFNIGKEDGSVREHSSAREVCGCVLVPYAEDRLQPRIPLYVRAASVDSESFFSNLPSRMYLNTG